MADSPDIIVGIDLGTTNSLVAICDERGPRVLNDADGQALVPSVVRYEDGRTIVGRVAKEQAAEFPTTTISSVKRLMGRSLKDAQNDLAYLSYRVVAGERDTARVAMPRAGREPLLISPEEVSAAVLRRLKEIATAALGREVTRAVVTVPAYFDDAQRQATRIAGRLAGLDVVRIVPEPTAAALAYGIGLGRAAARNQKESAVVVYDLGGGTFDVSVLKLTPGSDESEPFFFQVMATSGDTHLGGDDIDHVLVGLLRRGLGIEDDAELSASMRRRLLSLAEQAKIELSDSDTARVRIEMEQGGEKEVVITRAELETIAAPFIDQTIRSCEAAVRDALGKPLAELRAGPVPAIDAVVLVGGSTRMPLVRRRVAELFGLEPYIALDPDRVVALGAAVQAAVLGGQAKGTLLLDVIPLSLGIETVGGAVAKIIARNTMVPIKATEMFSTSVDGQTSIRLTVFQGEREMAADCRKLGEFHLRGLPPMPAGVPQAEVQFLIDANGVLNVSAVERRSGKRASLQVVPNHGLTQEEVDRIERESLVHAREDMTRHRIVDLIANGKLDLKWVGDALGRVQGELPGDVRASVETAMTNLRELITAAESDWRVVDATALHRAKEALDRASVPVHEVAIAHSLRGTQAPRQ
ncbi:MAG: Hsp70 family protein [Planctomycetes bacterium]|nr:Hsp70 family protein [Planctomycetota bacterium]